MLYSVTQYSLKTLRYYHLTYVYLNSFHTGGYLTTNHIKIKIILEVAIFEV